MIVTLQINHKWNIFDKSLKVLSPTIGVGGNFFSSLMDEDILSVDMNPKLKINFWKVLLTSKINLFFIRQGIANSLKINNDSLHSRMM